MFARRHEQELAEIKALTYELRHRLDEILEELRRIEEKTESRAQPPDWGAPAEHESDRTPTSGGAGAKPGKAKRRGEAGQAKKVRRGEKARRREGKGRQGASAPSVADDEE